MTRNIQGVTLMEVMIAVGITALIGSTIFQLFQQNERLFQDQNLVLEVQQNVRAVVSQIADEIRMGGQGVPLYSTTFDSVLDEATSVVLNGSDATHLFIRSGISNIASHITSSVPLDFTLGSLITVDIENVRPFQERLGTMPSAGRFVYLWGPAGDSWGWMRAEVRTISGAANRISLIARQAGTAGRFPGLDGVVPSNDDGIRFTAPPTITLEEMIAIYLDAGSVKRATATNATSLTLPGWGPAAELGQNFTLLNFRYYTSDDVEISTPVSGLADRLQIARIDIQAAAKTSEPISSGARLGVGSGLRVIPRNLSIRSLLL